MASWPHGLMALWLHSLMASSHDLMASQLLSPSVDSQEIIRKRLQWTQDSGVKWNLLRWFHVISPLDPQSSIQSLWRRKAPTLNWDGAAALSLPGLTASTIQPSSGQTLRPAWFFATAGWTSEHLRHCDQGMMLFSGLRRKPPHLLPSLSSLVNLVTEKLWVKT